MATIKDELLIKIGSLKSAVENEDIDTLIYLIDNMGFDDSKSSLMVEFTKQIIVNFISDYIKKKGLDTLRVKRTSAYGTEVYDTYQRDKENLFRNGYKIQWTSLGKLYQAYEYIKKE